MRSNINSPVPNTRSSTSNATPVSGTIFDYHALPVETASDLRQSAERIRSLVRRSIADIVEAGRELTRVKERVAHGNFGAWLKAEVGIPERTAQNYMRAAAWAEDKSEIISFLHPAALYLLSSPSTPAGAQADIANRIKAGERVSVDEVRHIVDAAKFKAKQSPEQKKRTDRLNEKRAERWKLELERGQAAKQAVLNELADFLRVSLGPGLSRFIALAETASDYIGFFDLVRELRQPTIDAIGDTRPLSLEPQPAEAHVDAGNRTPSDRLL